MFKVYVLVALIALANCAPMVDSDLPASGPIQQVQLPCLHKVAGQRLRHPSDSHKFLRCVTADTLWVETCPDGLFYNPTLEICDWSVESKATTPSNEIVKHRPVLVKVKPKFNFVSKSQFDQAPASDMQQDMSQDAQRDVPQDMSQ